MHKVGYRFLLMLFFLIPFMRDPDQQQYSWQSEKGGAIQPAIPLKFESSITAGPIFVEALLTYEDRDYQLQYGRNYYCVVYDYDLYSPEDYLWSGETGRYGDLLSELIVNSDVDDDDGDSRLDIFVKCWTKSQELEQRVYDTGGNVYAWSSPVSMNVPGNTSVRVSTFVPYEDINVPAMWIYEDVLRTYEYWNILSGYTPAAVSVVWQSGIEVYGPCFGSCYMGGNFPEIFINFQRSFSADTTVHEIGHAYMDYICDWLGTCSSLHYINRSSSPECAWSEGWADFLPLYINGDPCYDFGKGPCNDFYFDLEEHNLFDDPNDFHFGEAVEGRVAGALYDLVDGINEPLDLTAFPLSDVVDVLHFPQPAIRFQDFWDHWLALGFNNSTELMSTFYLNTAGKKIYLPLIIAGG